MSEAILPSPARVLATIGHGLVDATLVQAILVSLRRLAAGYALATTFGIGLGLWMGKSKLIEDTLGSFIFWLQTIPSIAYMPLVVLWFGPGEVAILFVIVFAASWPIIINTDSGIKNISRNLVDAARTMGAKGATIFWEVLLPGALPTIISGMRLSWAFSWRALIAGELLSQGIGLGQSLMHGKEIQDMSLVIAVLILIAALGSIIDGLLFKRAEALVRRKWGLVKV